MLGWEGVGGEMANMTHIDTDEKYVKKKLKKKKRRIAQRMICCPHPPKHNLWLT